MKQQDKEDVQTFERMRQPEHWDSYENEIACASHVSVRSVNVSENAQNHRHECDPTQSENGHGGGTHHCEGTRYSNGMPRGASVSANVMTLG